MKIDPQRVGRELAVMVKQYVEPVRAAMAAENAVLAGRVQELEQKLVAVTPRQALIDRRGVLFLTLGDGSVQELGQVVGKAAEPAELRSLVAELVDDAVGRLPAPQPVAPAPTPPHFDPAEVRSLVAELVEDAIGRLPVPKDGQNADPAEIRRQVEAELERALQGLQAPKAVTPEDLRPLVGQVVEAALKALPAPPAPKAVTPEDLRPLVGQVVEAELEQRLKGVPALVDEAVETAIGALPAPKDGQDGKDVDPVELRTLVGVVVAQGLKDMPRLVAEDVDAAIAKLPAPAVPTPEDLRPIVGQVVEAEVERALQGLPEPAPGRGVAGVLIDDAGDLVVTMTDGENVRAGHVKGAPGDAVEDLEVESEDGGRTLTLRLKVGGAEIVRRVTTAALIDRGVWRQGDDYLPGDGVTYKGSYWIAERAKARRPGDDDSGWRLAVKRGRDGRDAQRAPAGARV